MSVHTTSRGIVGVPVASNSNSRSTMTMTPPTTGLARLTQELRSCTSISTSTKKNSPSSFHLDASECGGKLYLHSHDFLADYLDFRQAVRQNKTVRSLRVTMSTNTNHNGDDFTSELVPILDVIGTLPLLQEIHWTCSSSSSCTASTARSSVGLGHSSGPHSGPRRDTAALMRVLHKTTNPVVLHLHAGPTPVTTDDLRQLSQNLGRSKSVKALYLYGGLDPIRPFCSRIPLSSKYGNSNTLENEEAQADEDGNENENHPMSLLAADLARMGTLDTLHMHNMDPGGGGHQELEQEQQDQTSAPTPGAVGDDSGGSKDEADDKNRAIRYTLSDQGVLVATVVTEQVAVKTSLNNTNDTNNSESDAPCGIGDQPLKSTNGGSETLESHGLVSSGTTTVSGRDGNIRDQHTPLRQDFFSNQISAVGKQKKGKITGTSKTASATSFADPSTSAVSFGLLGHISPGHVARGGTGKALLGSVDSAVSVCLTDSLTDTLSDMAVSSCQAGEEMVLSGEEMLHSYPYEDPLSMMNIPKCSGLNSAVTGGIQEPTNHSGIAIESRDATSTTETETATLYTGDKLVTSCMAESISMSDALAEIAYGGCELGEQFFRSATRPCLDSPAAIRGYEHLTVSLPEMVTESLKATGSLPGGLSGETQPRSDPAERVSPSVRSPMRNDTRDLPTSLGSSSTKEEIPSVTSVDESELRSLLSALSNLETTNVIDPTKACPASVSASPTSPPPTLKEHGEDAIELEFVETVRPVPTKPDGDELIQTEVAQWEIRTSTVSPTDSSTGLPSVRFLSMASGDKSLEDVSATCGESYSQTMSMGEEEVSNFLPTIRFVAAVDAADPNPNHNAKRDYHRTVEASPSSSLNNKFVVTGIVPVEF